MDSIISRSPLHLKTLLVEKNNMKKYPSLHPTTRLLLSGTSVVFAAAVYLFCVYYMYETLRHPQAQIAAPARSGMVKNSTVRLQEDLEGFFVAADEEATLFPLVEDVGTRYGTTVVVESITNPQVYGKDKKSPVSVVDVKTTVLGQWEAVQKTALALEQLPYISRITDVEIIEDKDAHAPSMKVSLRFFIIAPRE
jgi:hypothetical protein